MMAGSTVQMPAFTQPELMSLLLAARLAVQHVDYYNESLAMALNKLAGTLPKGPVSAHVGETASQLTEKPEDEKRERVFGAITRGLLARKQLRFDYVDADGKATKRHVHPYFLEPVSLMTRGIYLVAKDIDRKEIRIFKLDRIREAEVLAADAYVPSDFELKKLVANSWGIWTNGAIIEVELLFSAAVARRVLETRWHPSQEIERQPGGQLKMTLKVRGVVEITPWILSWGADVEVLKPAALRNALAETVERLAAAYSKKPG
jgi:proteasome accessory factor B